MVTASDAIPLSEGVRHPGGHRSIVQAAYSAAGSATSVARIYESGSLRVRHPKRSGCEAVVVNTGGGIVAGDALSIDMSAGPGSALTVTGAAAEKVYRSEGATAAISTRLSLGPGGSIAWLPQETILFDGARLRRRFEVDMAADAAFVAAEMVVFGRTAHGERSISGVFRDSWRVRRAGRLIFADETRLDGDIGATLARGAVANGACAVAVLLVAGPSAHALLDPVRATLTSYGPDSDAAVEGGASLKDGIIVARLIARSSEPLRRAVADILAVVRGTALPRVWQ